MEYNLEPFDQYYDAFEQIGKGHFAVVRICVEKATGRRYAAKFVRKRRVTRGLSQEDIRREVDLLCQLSHHNIVTLHQVFDNKNEVILVLELVEGGELCQYIFQKDCLSEHETKLFIKQILDALTHIHSQNIAHLDLKPENMLLNSDCSQIKLIDFGLSQRLNSDPESHTIRAMFGTPEFVAPEIVNYEPLSTATDMWALGVIAYNMLSGASPFLGENNQDTFTKIVSGLYSFDEEYFACVSELAKDFISQLLIKNPRSRSTADECLEHPWLRNDEIDFILKLKNGKQLNTYQIKNKNAWLNWKYCINVVTMSIRLRQHSKFKIYHHKEDNLVVVALHCAALEGNVNGLEELLTLAKVDVHVTNKNGESTCHVAAGQGQLKVLEFLRSKNASFEQTDDTGATPLMWAARYGQIDTVRYLLKEVSITTQDEEGNTALHHAALHGHFEILPFFLEAGANLDICNHSGATPLHLALYNKHQQAAIFLLHAGADIDIVDLNGEAAIHLVAREGMTVVAQTLCAFGCNVELPNSEGQYPIHLAARYGHIDIIRCLCLAGCNIEQRNGDGIKAEIVGYKQGFNEISNLLNQLKITAHREELIKQLIPTIQPLGRINVKLFGHSGVGKTTLISTMKAGYFTGLFRKAKSIQSNTNNAHNTNLSVKIKSEFDVPAKNYLGLNSNNYTYTRGIEVHKVNLSGVGNVTLWDFSGQDTYFQMYDHFVGTTNCIHIIIYNLEDPPSIQYQQCVFWFTFLQARIPPAEPLGENGIANRLAQVLIVATHPDTSKIYSQQNLYKSDQTDKLLEQLKRLFQHVFEIHSQVIVVDAQVSSSPGIKLIKNYLYETKQIILQTMPKWTGFLESVVEWLTNFRKACSASMREVCVGDGPTELEQSYSHLFPIQSWRTFMQMIRAQVNPLAGEDHLRELLQQLLIMGEVILIKSHYEDLVCTNPNWLCGTVIGTLLSIEFVARARVTGCYSIEDFQSAFPEADSLNILHVLEALQLCTQCEIEEEEIEFEFPTFNFVEKIEGLWDPTDPRYQSSESCYGGVRLRTPNGTCHLLHCIFPRLQVQFRRTTQRSDDSENDLYQWFEGSKLCSGSIESLVTLEEDEEVIEIKVRGPPGMQMACFYFIEELLGIIDQVLLEMSPGLPIEKHVLSSYQLRSHSDLIHSWPPEALMAAILQPEGFMSYLENPITGDRETIVDLVAFGSCQIIDVILTGDELPVNALSTSCRQQLCSALDPADPLGRDWCLLAVRLGLAEKLASLDETAPSYSRTARLLDTWMTYSNQDANIGTLIRKLEELGRHDSVEILLRNAPLYRILPSSLQAFYSNEINNISQFSHSIPQSDLATTSPANTVSRTYLSR